MAVRHQETDVKPSLFLALSFVALGCGDGDRGALDTPATPIEGPLAGEWLTGTLSTLQYYDVTSGTWLDPSGEGFYYVIDTGTGSART